jgi:hypothetical protein
MYTITAELGLNNRPVKVACNDFDVAIKLLKSIIKEYDDRCFHYIEEDRTIKHWSIHGQPIAVTAPGNCIPTGPDSVWADYPYPSLEAATAAWKYNYL